MGRKKVVLPKLGASVFIWSMCILADVAREKRNILVFGIQHIDYICSFRYK